MCPRSQSLIEHNRRSRWRFVSAAWATLALSFCGLLLTGCSSTAQRPNDQLCQQNTDCLSGLCATAADRERRCTEPSVDIDSDGLDAVSEEVAGTDPFSADTDGDGLSDAQEVGPNPSDAIDSDGDGKVDAVESNTADNDGDCIPDHLDSDDLQPATQQQLVTRFCAAGVCVGATTGATCEPSSRTVTCQVSGEVPYQANSETSCDGLDNDCDGEVDEQLDGLGGAICGISGVCAGAQTSRCVAGKWACTYDGIDAHQALETLCDGLDNDCDGKTDELPVCEDNIECTVDSCDAVKGCQHVPKAAACDDNNPCTIDVCAALEGCKYLSRIGLCDDGDPCTNGESCVAGACVGNSPTICDDGNPCTIDSCDSTTGCVFTNLAEDSPCKPNDACFQAGVCTTGQCVGSSPVNCDDNNPCTVDACIKATGECQHAASAGPCDDNNPCTVDDACEGKLCTGAAKPSCCVDATGCDDGNPCTEDQCEDGACSFGLKDQVPCDDGNPCTVEALCAKGTCDGGKFTACDDNQPCTLDICALQGGQKTCSYTPLPDGANCDDGDICNGFSSCSQDKGVNGPPLNCDDSNPCTKDVCDVAKGCVHTTHKDACDDNNACTVQDTCVSGSCLGDALVCDDLNSCTADACAIATGCVYLPGKGACDDGDPCTVNDSCTKGGCEGAVKACDDQKACTLDSCSPVGACVHDTANVEGSGCDDGDVCTLGDVCKSGLCVAGVKISCDDGNACTVNQCDPISGQCQSSFKTGPCVTPTGCTADATCNAGLCVGNPISDCCKFNSDCDDLNPCTIDSCDKSKGACSHAAVSGLACNDGSACTSGDICTGGLCQGSSQLNCDDGKPCTLDYCLPLSGCKQIASVGGSCSDGDACNGLELCELGVCKAAKPLVCEDSNACTVNLCKADSGCVFPWRPPGTECDDGSKCTTSDACDGKGSCLGKPSVSPECCIKDGDCDDGYPCTTDTCDTNTATCSYAPLVCKVAGSCDVGWCAVGTCNQASRCLSPVVFQQDFSAGSPGWSFTADSYNTLPDSGWSVSTTGLGDPALKCSLATGSYEARLPPLALPSGNWIVKLSASLDLDSTDCSKGSLQILAGGQKLVGGNLCATPKGPEALSLPLAVTEAQSVVEISMRFVGVAPQVDPKRGAVVDDVWVVAAPSSPGCTCAP